MPCARPGKKREEKRREEKRRKEKRREEKKPHLGFLAFFHPNSTRRAANLSTY
jgi:hypothetical protein